MMMGRRNVIEGRRRFLTGEVSKRGGKVLHGDGNYFRFGFHQMLNYFP